MDRKLFPCTQCALSYAHESSLVTHVKKEHVGLKFECTMPEECIKKYGKVKIFKEQGFRDRHVKEVHLGQKRKSKEATCPECGKLFSDTQKLGDHRDAKHLDNKYYCDKEGCDYFAKTKPILSYHKRKCFNKLRCETCTRSFASDVNLRNHYKSSTNKCTPAVVQPVVDLVPKESARIAQKRKYEAGNPSKKFLYTVADKLKNFITDSTPTKDGKRRCYAQDCMKTRLAYGELGGDKISCEEHKKSDHVNLSEKLICVYKGCTTRGHVTIKDCSEYFCTPHAKLLVHQGLPEESVNWTKNGNYCFELGCEVVASFDQGRYCERHSPTKVSDDTRVCEHEGCTSRRPTFGYIGRKKTKCIKHKEDGMYSRKLCDHPGCFIGASYGPSGGVSSRCLKHKKEGDIVESRCAMACCKNSEGIQAKFFHPEHEDKASEYFGKRVCSFARRFLVEAALMSKRNDDYTEVKRLLDHFGLKEVVTLNAQSAVMVACEKEYYGLLKDCVQLVSDESVIGQAKSLGNRRPDIFYKWDINNQGFAIHIEYDEKSSHENDVARLERIAREAGCEGKTYVIRVRGGHDTKDPVCKPVQEKYYKYYVVSESGREVCRRVAELVKERIEWIHEGLAPNSERKWSIVV